jgi:hypothetical protein
MTKKRIFFSLRQIGHRSEVGTFGPFLRSKLLLINIFATSCSFTTLSAMAASPDSIEGRFFYLENASLVQPYASVDTSLEPLELSRLLNEADYFPRFHEIVEGDGTIIGVRIMTHNNGVHSNWSEKFTFALPRTVTDGEKTKRYEVPQLLGFYSHLDKEGQGSSMFAVSSSGALTISILDRNRIQVSVDIDFKRVDVDPSLYELEEDERVREYFKLDERKYVVSNSYFKYKKSFVAERKLYSDLTPWEGMPLTEEEKNECFVFCDDK